jgi:2-oxoglutarate ferredoxin oxidoreductase subunit gamma
MGMDTKTEIRLAGFGGQGIVLAGQVLGKAPCSNIFLRCSPRLWTGGPGRGACSADVVLSRMKFIIPGDLPQILVLMSERQKYLQQRVIRPVTVLIDEIWSAGFGPGRQPVVQIPATHFAEKLGRKIVANIVMLGFCLRPVVGYKP